MFELNASESFVDRVVVSGIEHVVDDLGILSQRARGNVVPLDGVCLGSAMLIRVFKPSHQCRIITIFKTEIGQLGMKAGHEVERRTAGDATVTVVRSWR